MLLYIPLFDRSSEGNFMVIKRGSVGHTLISNHHQSQMKQIEKQLILFFSQLSTLQVVTETSSLICIKTKLLSRTCIKKFQFWIVASPPTDPLPHPRRFYSNICGSLEESYQRKVGQVMCTGKEAETRAASKEIR